MGIEDWLGPRKVGGGVGGEGEGGSGSIRLEIHNDVSTYYVIILI